MTGESWRYPEVKTKNREFWVLRSCYLIPYHIYILLQVKRNVAGKNISYRTSICLQLNQWFYQLWMHILFKKQLISGSDLVETIKKRVNNYNAPIFAQMYLKKWDPKVDPPESVQLYKFIL